MTDFHRNIFYFYRGQQTSDKGREQQLEDNTTKALINTLEGCKLAVVERFLESLGIRNRGAVKFELQKPDLGEGKLQRQTQRLILALVPAKEERFAGFDLKQEVDGESRPDAWIYGEDFVILVESKLGSPLDEMQLRRHHRILQRYSERIPVLEVRTWAEIHRLSLGILEETPSRNSRDHFLLEQFSQYLEWMGMSEFTGLDEGIFDYFIKHDDDEVRQWVRGAMDSLAQKLLRRLQIFNSFYEDYDLGTLRLKDNYCWVAFGPGGKKYRSIAHQTVSLSAYALEVFVNVERKSAVEKLRRKMIKRGAEFRALVSSVSEPFQIRIEERRQRQASIYDYYPVATLESFQLKSPELAELGFKYLLDLMTSIRTESSTIVAPYFTLRRRIPRDEVLALCREDQGETFLNHASEIMQEFHPLIEFINEP